MKKSFKVIGLAAALLFSTQGFAQNIDLYKNIEFKMSKVAETSFPAKRVFLTEFGGVPGGTVKNTEAFRKAIDALSKKGGGRLVVPRGMWLTGPIELKSNINLHVEEGAFIVFSKDKNDYPLVDVSFEGLNTIRCQSPISAKNATNIAITGKGVIDGSGDAWRAVKKARFRNPSGRKSPHPAEYFPPTAKTGILPRAIRKDWKAAPISMFPIRFPKISW
uniref:Pectate lyase superfamily protein domain-containing protein n=1 Tax=Chryseobacterium endophyticum TaxID=1854762 RepID=A0AAU6WL43_9FLAO